jgi:hypothetical protein
LVRYLLRMVSLIRLLFSSVVACVRSPTALAAEILALRHQLLVFERSRHARLLLTPWDRALWALVLRRWSGWKHTLVLVKPQTVILWQTCCRP